MKQLIIIVLGLTIFWGCKESSEQKLQTPIKQSALKKDSVSRPQIKVYTIVHDSVSSNDTEQLTELINGLDEIYKEDKITKDNQRLKERLDIYKRNGFKKVLARDFENEDFTKAVQTHVTFLKCHQKDMPANLRVEEWIFEKESTAISCFKSLTTHEERIIYFKAISWIFLQQKNKIFLVFAMDYNVDDEPMQTIKRHLIDDLKEKGEYRIVEID